MTLTKEQLQLLMQLIELTTSRGAFHAQELSAVGNLYDLLKRAADSVEQ